MIAWMNTLDLYKTNQRIKIHCLFCDFEQVTEPLYASLPLPVKWESL